MIGKLESCLKYGIPILGLSIICPTFWLILGVTLAGLIIGVQLVRTASKKQSREVKKAGMKRVSQWKYKPPVHKPEDHFYVSRKAILAELEKAKEEREAHERKWGWVGEAFQWLVYLAFFGFLVTGCVQGNLTDRELTHCAFHYRGACNG